MKKCREIVIGLTRLLFDSETMILSGADSLRRPRPALPADPGRLRRAPQRGRGVEEELRARPQDGGALRPDGALRPGEGRQSRRGREEGELLLGVARAEALREAGAAHVLDRVLGEATLRLCDSPLIFFCHPGCSAFGVHHPTWPLSGGWDP